MAGSIPQKWVVEAEDAVDPNAGFGKKLYFVRKGEIVYQAVDSIEADHLCSELNRLDEMDRKLQKNGFIGNRPQGC